MRKIKIFFIFQKNIKRYPDSSNEITLLFGLHIFYASSQYVSLCSLNTCGKEILICSENQINITGRGSIENPQPIYHHSH